MTLDEVKIHLPKDYLKLERPGRLVNMLAIMKNSSLLFCDLYMNENNFLDLSQVKCNYFRLRLTRDIYYPALLII
jgi:hypothetical protein